ncbi:hypothetical protein [uncultured Campylobacter sp.]|uniref:hypothetical protein n=1 Tax=uncultured Campylobacter sp. TaxID=218934 RepID=UPI0026340408|nr:hypothetical protein [uncultured Campylobacter sp.]
MKRIKLLTAAVIAGLMLVGCGEDDGLVKLENANPAIDQAHFDVLIAKIQSEIPNKDFKIYSIESAFNEPYKSKITDRTMSVLLTEKAENRLTRDDDKVLTTSVLVANDKDKAQFFIFRIMCENKECVSPMTLQWK